MTKIILLVLLSGSLYAQPFTKTEIARWQKQAARVSIIRDQYGIAHVYGKTDADAVFGFLYAQCEDDFERVELNYINAVARMAEVEGESKLYSDLRMRLFYDTAQAIAIYKTTPPALKKLCEAFADGINYYLHTHANVKPKLLKRFKPWMPLLFSEGSIGGDIETISVSNLKEFYGEGKSAGVREAEDHNDPEPEPRGSNGFAIAPSKSASGNALLLINPHTSFYFRPEIHIASEEGLNAYGAVTWGQFFIYQGFNQFCGWMHTSSQADCIDEYKETIINRNDSLLYQYGKSLRPITSKKIKLAYKTSDNKINHREFTVRYTHHGPVVAKQGDHWISIKLMQEPLKALTQSFQRTKSKGFDDFKNTMQLKTNSSNNTVFADNKGNIAYWHGNFIPKRNAAYNWAAKVDGSDPNTEWNGLHAVDETVHIYNPANGWIQNCNSTPFTASAGFSPVKNNYPTYMAPDAENARGIHANMVLKNEQAFTLDKLIAAAYDPYLPGFDELIPSLIYAYESVGSAKSNEQIELLRKWDKKFSTTSVATTLAIYWGQDLRQLLLSRAPSGLDQLTIIDKMFNETTNKEKISALENVIAELERDYGTWKVAWGEVNRFQRLTGKVAEEYDDSKKSWAVPYASSFWGSLAAFGSRKFPGTKKMYGYVGNSFVAVVEFGKELKAKSLLAGGVSNNPSSPYFTNQAERYCSGEFKDVLFYKKDVVKNSVRTYNPGM
jgi:acyl-homoserine-lactone acylase